MLLIYNKLKSAEKYLGVSMATIELEIIFSLYENGHTPATKLASKTKASTAGFSKVLKRLADIKIVEFQRSSDDQRMRYYYLSEPIRAKLDEILT